MKKDVLLDFTSLLDVTLIVIFFFVIFSNLENQQTKARVDEKINELAHEIQEAEEKQTEAIQLAEELQKEIAFVQEYDERKAANEAEMINFMRGENLKLIMVVSSSSKWRLKVTGSGDYFTVIESGEDVAAQLFNSLKNMGLDGDKTILCNLIYNGDEVGSRTAYNIVKRVMAEIRKEYPYFYVSEADISVEEE